MTEKELKRTFNRYINTLFYDDSAELGRHKNRDENAEEEIIEYHLSHLNTDSSEKELFRRAVTAYRQIKDLCIDFKISQESTF